MSLISVKNLTFGYDGDYINIFENVSFNIDTDWKLGLIGRNGKGKTTFLKLLQGKFEYKGTILKNVDFDYFPFEIKNKLIKSTFTCSPPLNKLKFLYNISASVFNKFNSFIISHS